MDEKPQKPLINPEFYGIKGWLILLAIIILKAPIETDFITYSDCYVNGIASSDWCEVTHPQSTEYIPHFKTVVALQALINSLFFLDFLVTIYLFFTKKRRFKKFYTVLLIVSPICFLGFSAVSSALLNLPLMDGAMMQDFGKSIISVLIWTSYIRQSKRVAHTFIY